MKNILDQEQKKFEKGNTNYRKWSFRLLIYTIITNLTIFWLTIDYIEIIHDESTYTRNIGILEIANYILIALGCLLTYLGYKNNEEKDYKMRSSIIGFSILIGLTILALMMNFIL